MGLKMFEDYPAAHSMDTEWYAVDEDGYIAKFDSESASPVPTSFLDKFCHDKKQDSIFDVVINHLPKDERGWIYLECDHNLIDKIFAEKDTIFEKNFQEIANSGQAKIKKIFLVVKAEAIIDELEVKGHVICLGQQRIIFFLENACWLN